jgi:hypothetical protein
VRNFVLDQLYIWSVPSAFGRWYPEVFLSGLLRKFFIGEAAVLFARCFADLQTQIGPSCVQSGLALILMRLRDLKIEEISSFS